VREKILTNRHHTSISLCLKNTNVEMLEELHLKKCLITYQYIFFGIGDFSEEKQTLACGTENNNGGYL